MAKNILVSSCLIGKNCSYDGTSRDSSAVRELCSEFGCIDICPEIAGGLSCPRERHECSGGTGGDVLDGKAHVISVTGRDHTAEFVNGAGVSLNAARERGVVAAVLKAKSPSCGFGKIHVGKFTGELCAGNGVTAEILFRNGIRVFTEHEVAKARVFLLSLR